MGFTDTIFLLGCWHISFNYATMYNFTIFIVITFFFLYIIVTTFYCIIKQVIYLLNKIAA